MSSVGERKSALLLLTLRRSDRRRLLAQLPPPSASRIRALLGELERLPFATAELAEVLLADEVRGLTESTSPGIDELVALSQRLPPVWFARVLSVWTGIDRGFCLALLDDAVMPEVRAELARVPSLPPRLVEALQAEASALAIGMRDAA
ncbi:MAG: hypothetical protein M3Q42_00375 [Pseudomonadota bacterium]|nr:hypothetical protein [Pseudomonadota bacterium]